jgi:hypothetical protein
VSAERIILAAVAAWAVFYFGVTIAAHLGWL